MSIISGLLTGGVLIGKVCQALSGLSSDKKFVHQASGVKLYGDVSSGGVKFYRKEVDGISTIYAANQSTDSSATIVVPNDNETAGITYVLRPLSSLPFAEAESSNVPPTTNVITGLTGSSTSELGDPKAALFKLAFKGLQVGKVVNVGSFRLSCTTTQLVVFSTQITAGALTYMWLNSNKGVSASSQTRITPTPPTSPGNQNDVEQSFTVDFNSLGIDPAADLIEGQVTFEVNATTEELSALSKVQAKPFDDAEKAYFSISA